MDEDLLREKGLNPENSRRAYLEGFQLIIGERATLIPLATSCSYGTVMALSVEELLVLYEGDVLKDYLPQSVQVNTMSGDQLEVNIYLLPEDKVSGCNREYALQLARVAEKLAFPGDYIGEIKRWT